MNKYTVIITTNNIGIHFTITHFKRSIIIIIIYKGVAQFYVILTAHISLSHCITLILALLSAGIT